MRYWLTHNSFIKKLRAKTVVVGKYPIQYRLEVKNFLVSMNREKLNMLIKSSANLVQKLIDKPQDRVKDRLLHFILRMCPKQKADLKNLAEDAV